MWNRRKEEPTDRPLGSPSATPSTGNEGMPMQTMPTRYDNETPTAPRAATIGKGVSITGQIFSKEDLIIDGEVDGTVEAHDHKLTIGPNGKEGRPARWRHQDGAHSHRRWCIVQGFNRHHSPGSSKVCRPQATANRRAKRFSAVSVCLPWRRNKALEPGNQLTILLLWYYR